MRKLRDTMVRGLDQIRSQYPQLVPDAEEGAGALALPSAPEVQPKYYL